MSRENVRSFCRSIDAWNRGDLETWLQGAHPDIEFHPSAALVEGAYHGHDGFRKFWSDIDAAFDELVTNYDEIRVHDDAVVGLGRIRGRSKQGFPVDLEYGLVVRYRDGLAVWARSWFSHADAIEAAGLDDGDASVLDARRA